MKKYNNEYSGLAIADYFIKKANQDNKPITNMTVLKMIYFAQIFSFLELSRQLIKDDFYAWKWGAVEIETYRTFCKYDGNPISSCSGKTKKELSKINDDVYLIKFLDKIYLIIDADTNVLTNKMREVGSPWDLTQSFKVIDFKKTLRKS